MLSLFSFLFAEFPPDGMEEETGDTIHLTMRVKRFPDDILAKITKGEFVEALDDLDDPSLKGEVGKTIVHFVVYEVIRQGYESSLFDTFESFLKNIAEKDADILNTPDERGVTPLVLLITEDQYSDVQEPRQGRKNAEKYSAELADMQSHQSKQAEFVRALVMQGADPQAESSGGKEQKPTQFIGRYPVQWAIRKNNFPVFKVLMDQGGALDNPSYDVYLPGFKGGKLGLMQNKSPEIYQAVQLVVDTAAEQKKEEQIEETEDQRQKHAEKIQILHEGLDQKRQERKDKRAESESLRDAKREEMKKRLAAQREQRKQHRLSKMPQEE